MKRVLCSDCGFLCWHISDVRDDMGMLRRWGEIVRSHRDDLAAGTIKATFDEYEGYDHF